MEDKSAKLFEFNFSTSQVDVNRQGSIDSLVPVGFQCKSLVLSDLEPFYLMSVFLLELVIFNQ